MKNNLLIVSGLILFTCIQLKAQWIQTAGPNGGNIRAIAVDSPFVFVGGDYAGVYMSSDNGYNWNRATNGLTSLRVMSLINVSGNLFAGMDVNGIFLSTNNGANWTQLTNGLPLPTSTVVFCFTSDGNTVYAGTNQGIFMTTNFGANWTAINNGIISLDIRSILVNGTDMFATTSDGVYYSNNGGANWTSVSNGLNNNPMGYLAMVDTTLFASALWNDSLFISQNNGNTWSPINFSTNYAWTTCLFSDNGKLYAGTDLDWLYVSQDTGLTWQQLNNGILHKGINQISKIGGNLITATSGGIYQSSNGGLNWIKTDTSLAATDIYDLYRDGSNLFAACFGNGVSMTADRGNTWSTPNAVIGSEPSRGVTVKNNNVFADGSSGVLFSPNYGLNWSFVNNGLGSNGFSSIVTNTNGVLAAANAYGLFYSTNNGSNWTQITSGITDPAIENIIINGDTAFFSTYNQRIFRSIDGGMNWTMVYQGTAVFNPIWQMAMNGNLVVAASEFGVLVSSDLGNTWNFANNGLSSTTCIAIEILGINLWTSTFEGVFFSNDFGANWTNYHSGLDTLQWLYSFELDSNYIYGGGRACGVWKRSLLDFPLSVSEISNQEKAIVYPNPFSTEANVVVNFNLRNATMKIYNSFGQEVIETKNISGKSIILNRGNLIAGIYFMSLTQDSNEIITKKLIITE